MALPTRTLTYDTLQSYTKDVFDGAVENEVWGVSYLSYLLWNQREKNGTGNVLPFNLEYYKGTDDVQNVSTTNIHNFDFTKREIGTQGYFSPFLYMAQTLITKQEQTQNQGPAKIADIAEAKYNSLQNQLTDYRADVLWGSTYGIQAAMDASPATGTWGNIDKADSRYQYAWRHTADTTTTLAGLTPMKVQSMINTLTVGKRNANLKKTLIGVTTQAIWEKLAGQVDARQVFGEITGEGNAKLGYQNIQIAGVPITIDTECPAGYMYLFNTKYMKLKTYPDWDMTATPWMDLTVGGTLGLGKVIYFGGFFKMTGLVNHGLFSALT